MLASDIKGGTKHTIDYFLQNNKKILVYWDRKGFHREGNSWLKDRALPFSSKMELNKVLA